MQPIEILKDTTVSGPSAPRLPIEHNAQPPNTICAGPPSGASNAKPTFRALVTADLPAAAPVALQDGATITWATAGAAVNNASVTLGGNRTLAITGAAAGASGLLLVTQDGTGSRTLALPANSKVFGAASAGVAALSTAAGSIDALSWYTADGTNFVWFVLLAAI